MSREHDVEWWARDMCNHHDLRSAWEEAGGEDLCWWVATSTAGWCHGWTEGSRPTVDVINRDQAGAGRGCGEGVCGAGGDNGSDGPKVERAEKGTGETMAVSRADERQARRQFQRLQASSLRREVDMLRRENQSLRLLLAAKEQEIGRLRELAVPQYYTLGWPYQPEWPTCGYSVLTEVSRTTPVVFVRCREGEHVSFMLLYFYLIMYDKT